MKTPRNDDATHGGPEAGGDQPGPANSDAALRRIGAALHGLRYGSVTVIVQDSVVVQIERLEKTRFTR